MEFFIISLVLYAIGSNAVLIDPTSNDEYISVQLTDDPRGLNEINSDNEWEIKDQGSNPLYDWALRLDLDAEKYSFKSGVDGSSISITMELQRGTTESDAHFAFSIGDKSYFTFMVDLDNYYNINVGSGDSDRTGIFIYPECGSTSIVSGDVSTMMSSIPSSDYNYVGVREELCGGDQDNCYQLTSSQNGANSPISFEFINNDLSDTFTFKFSSPSFSGNNALECTYDTSVDTGKDFKLYMSPDVGNSAMETIMIESFEIDGNSTGCICGGDWELICDHKDVDDGYFSTNLLITGLENENDPTANTYSIIGLFNDNDTLRSQYQDENERYKFKLIYADYLDGVPDSELIWTQTSWITESTITDANLTLIPDQSYKEDYRQFKGLALSSSSKTYVDGSDDYSNWWHSVGENTAWNGGIPGDYIAESLVDSAATSMSLYIWKPIYCDCSTESPTTFPPTTSNPTTSNPTTSTPTTAQPTTAQPTTAAPTTLEPTNNPTPEPTLDGCDFDIDAYLEQCYCTNDNYNEDQMGSPFYKHNENEYKYNNYQGYDDRMNKYNYNNEYYNGHDGNNNLLLYSILFLNIIMSITLGFLVSVHFGFCGKNNGQNRYEKVYVYSDPEDDVRNAINQ